MSGSVGGNAEMLVSVLLDGKEIARERFTEENSDVLRLIDLGTVHPGQHTVALKPTGEGNVMYQIVGEYYLPWRMFRRPPEPLKLAVKYDHTKLNVDDTLGATVSVRYNLEVPTFMVIVDLGIPPGFSVVPDAFEQAVAEKKIRRYSMTGRQITLYLGRMSKNRRFSLTYELRAKYPVRAKTPRSVAYEYYTPTSRGVQQPVPITITGG
ncbi:hypothetical protein ACFL6C_03285 [Myxococcota bacterium]